MSYLLDKKTKRDRYLRITFGLMLLGVLFYFRAGIFGGFSSAAQMIFQPILSAGNNVRSRFGGIGAYFSSKNSLNIQNQNLQSQIQREEARMANYNSLLAENESLKGILGRKTAKNPMVLAAILSQPGQNIYDTLLIDAGAAEGIEEGDIVFAYGSVPIGRIALVYQNSSKVILFSNPGEKKEVVISLGHSPTGEPGKNAAMELVGRGGGNFEMILPKDFILNPGDQVVLPGINPYLVAVVEKIISDPRDPSTRALLSSPVNVREIKFVEVEK